MNFNTHSGFEGLHAFLGASNYHWINYDEDKLKASFLSYLAKEKGTRLHALASECIKLGIKLPKSKKSLNMFVNDAIGFKMNSEQILLYSENAFGTADAISFKNGLLRIHDLKTGVTPTSMHQLEVYAALFCLEYQIKPEDINIELRIYQSDDIAISNPEPEQISVIMNKIVLFDKHIRRLKEEEL